MVLSQIQEGQSTKNLTTEQKHEVFLEASKKKLTSKKTASEVECKFFDNTADKCERDKNTQKVKNKIEKLWWNIIFDWEITDTRYFDTKNSSNSYLKNNGISMVRLREQINDWKTEYVFVIKSIDEDDNNQEFEIDVKELLWDSEFSEEEIIESEFAKKVLEERYGLLQIKQSSKKRIEYEVNIKWEREEEYKVKIAFDEYTDDKNKIIPPFFEVESDSEEWVKLAIEQLNLEDWDYKVTKGWPKKILKELWIQNDRELIEWLDITNNAIKRFKDEILKLLSDTIYVSVWDFLSWESNHDKNWMKEDELNKFLRRLLTNEIKDLIKKDDKYKHVLSRLIKPDTGLENDFQWNTSIGKKLLSIKKQFFSRLPFLKEKKENTTKMWKKFTDKLNRESTWYIKALSLSILEAYKDNNIIWNNNNDKFTQIVKEKLDWFMTALMLFDDTLTKDELQKFLSQSDDEISQRYTDIEKDVERFYSFIDESTNLPTWFLGSKNWKEALNSIFLVYRRSVAKAAFDWTSDLWLNTADILAENIKTYIWELFKNSAEDFSIWLNNPNKEEKNFKKISKNIKEILFFVYVFKNNKKSFSRILVRNFSKELMDACRVLYEDVLFDNKTFIDCEHDIKMFNLFLDNILDENGDGWMMEIKRQYEEYHNDEICKVLNKNIIDWWTAQTLYEYEWRLNKWEVEAWEINHDLWNSLSPDLRLKTFMKVVLEKKDEWKGFQLHSEVCKIDTSSKEGKKLFSTFLKYHYKEKNSDVSELDDDALTYTKWFIEYENNTRNQFDSMMEKLSLMNNSNYDSMYDFIENDVNSYHLLVAWNRFNLICNKIWGETVTTQVISQHKIKSQNFSETVLKKLERKRWWLSIWRDGKLINNLWAKLRVTTSDAYNSAMWDEEYIEKKFRRIINGKSVDLSTSYSYEELWKTTFFHKIVGLYMPKLKEWEDIDNLDKITAYIDSGFDVVRALLDDEEPPQNEYLTFLKKLGFPLNSEKHLNKLLEFLRFIKKFSFESVRKIHDNGVIDTQFLENLKAEEDFCKKVWVNEDEVLIGSVKAQSGIFRKGVNKQAWRSEKVWDPARMTLMQDNLEDLADVAANFIEYVADKDDVEEIWFEDKIWNMFQKADKTNGYRDGKIILVLSDWNTIEVQLQLSWYLHVKHKWLDSEELEKIQWLISWRDDLVFTEEEKEEVVRFSELTWIGLSEDFCKMFLSGINYESVVNPDQTFSADFTYNISRISDNEEIIKKINEIDRILFDWLAAWKVVRNEMERIMNAA